MRLFISSLSNTGTSPPINSPETDVPTGSPSVSIINDQIFVANQGSGNYRWYGRAAMKDIGNGIWACVYANAASHLDTIYSQLMIKFSDDYGETWSDENKYLDGTAITNFPMYPIGGEPITSSTGPGSPWIMVCPNGDLLCQMSNINFGSTFRGGHQSRSTDGGKTWSTPIQIAFQGTSIPDDWMFMQDDDFVLDGVIYSVARSIYDTETTPESVLFKSSDNGATWNYVSNITNRAVDSTLETGIEYVGNNTIIAHGRVTVPSCSATYLLISTDMGLTWTRTSPTNLQVLGRQRLKTRSHVKQTDNWWLDPVVISHGFKAVSAPTCTNRQLGLTVSKDFGATWYPFMALKTTSFDGGYGDWLWNPIKEEYVTINYYAPTSYYDGELRQINWKLIWS